ncbi:Lsr2 family protein [Rhodococcus erythropolis]|uniref:Lsr2 family protein n=1 Tax=Rhodococcus erythropolis TaxID=1833 RepID=A0A0C2ZVF1_RHOER|nr:Lsr2 family protein [Rhodococcus qingshengii]KAB2584362.1 Lsr2 family protein [Rhodococcus erythropolis]KIM16550.1 hypothetical protein QV65_13330 [Rhodococcus erythropolis]
MAERIIKQLIDDLDGNDIDEGFGQKVEFSYQGTDYTIDLRDSNVDKLEKALKPYIEAAQKIGVARKTRKGSGTPNAASGSGRSKEQLQAIRDWAVKNGFEVAPRGRIKAEVIDAFDAAH